MEDLFMQVFESRDRVTAQMRQQADSHAQSLARGFHLHRRRPPSWILHSCAAELNGKPIIPEFHFAGSQITTAATSRTVFLPAAVTSTSFTSLGVPVPEEVETIRDTLDANQHEAPQQKQVSVDQELAEAISQVKYQGAKRGSSDVMEDRIQRSEHATLGLNRTTASLSSKPCADGANNAGTTTSLMDQENGFHASEGRSTESFECSIDGDLGNLAAQLHCSQKQAASSDNNIKVPSKCPDRNLLEVQVTGSVCHALPETYLPVEPKKLQFNGVESVCMNPASEQTVKQAECALESANLDLAKAPSLNEVLVTGSVFHALPETYLSVEPKRLQFNGVKSVCVNPASEQTLQQPECSPKSANFDLAEAHSVNEVQVTGNVCGAFPETYLLVELKKLQFDGVESVWASEQRMQQPECALESTNFDLAEAHSLNEDPPSTSCSQAPRIMGRLLLDGVEPGYLNPDNSPLKQLQESVLECSNLGTHSMPDYERFYFPVDYNSPTIRKGPFESLYDSNAASGVWGTLSGKPRNYSFSDDVQQCSASDSLRGLELDSFFISDALASCSSDANSQQEISETAFTTSVDKYSLWCFQIDEDNSIPEEDEYQDRLLGPLDVNCSRQASGRKSLQDITGLCQYSENSPSVSTRCMDTGNIDSSAQCFSNELNHHSNIRIDHPSKPKNNHPTSVKRVGEASRSLHGRLGTAEKPSSRNGRHRSEANVGRQSKPSNIVANVTSFIPLVKQKMQPTAACVKKDVKVKALKAAEAAKRLEEKKQKEQEIRKAAAKVERERLKREKELKQKLEEEQKKKRDEEEKKKRDEDEQKKKREVDVATKKRQREEGEKKETMRKRKCIDESRKQQKQPMDRRRGTKDDKDARPKASDNMEPRKNLVDVGKNQVKPEETTEPAPRYKSNKSKDEIGVAVDERPASFGSDAKESTPNCHEESYKMSPFKDSDDDEDDDFEDEHESKRRMKFVPSWAQKENLDKILLSNITLDPREIFARKQSFNIPEFFSAYIPQRGLR